LLNSKFLNPPGGQPGPRPGFWVLTGSAGSILIFKKIQNDVVLVKKKVNGLQPGFWPGQPAGSAGSHQVMAYAIFSSTRPRSSPGSTCWAGPGYKTLVKLIRSLSHNSKFIKHIMLLKRCMHNDTVYFCISKIFF
jgi:hypothetical protein